LSSSAEYTQDGTLILDRPVKLPDVLDMLVVGGGPAGTAAAFRAKELGLAALVIDFDDVMKRIRDYAKDKLILPDYGGGDKMQFPNGGPFISLLHFAPLDKDDMCKLWKGFYREHGVPAQVGVELLGLQAHEGIWRARVYNHHTKSEQSFRARHVVIAVGRGVPRRFDIPGRTEGIAYRLSDSALYVGAPALIIGGGTSAAEAVIAVSHAKAQAHDPTSVYWSYRGDKLPKVSKALAEAFFDAYLGNGNIRHYPYSEPVAIVTGADQKEYLSLRIDRRHINDRPAETSHLEFSKMYCLACIGEDLPLGFLGAMGIEMAAAGPEQKKRFWVNPILETQQPNVYLIGDLLSPAYCEVDNFTANPAEYREIKRRGNIKAALRDGVLVAEAIAQKLAGKKIIHVDLDFAPAPPQAAEKAVIARATAIVEKDGPPRESLPPERVSEDYQAYLVRLLTGNVEENEYPIRSDGITTIGRNGCDINFPEDSLLSDHHASIAHGPEGYFLRDDGSTTGVFIRIKEARPVEVMLGYLVRIGKQFLLLNTEGGRLVVDHLDGNGKRLQRYPLSENTVVLGRKAPDITLDSEDMTLSRRHLSITVKGRNIFVKDLGSANGSFLKVKSAVALEAADQFRVGQQIFKFNVKEEAVRRTVEYNTEIGKLPASALAPARERTVGEAPAPKTGRPASSVNPAKPANVSAPAPAKRAEAAERPVEGMTVTFKNSGKVCAFKPGQTICDIAEKNGVKIKADCHIGSCGMDPIRILSGKENLDAIGDEEKGTLVDINKLKPGEYRLACMAKPKGAVVVEVVEQ
jgi:thioredoxin reductase/pSer/pThr/pTyr-binding forkhead associated (FHA) protein/ferredoxin